MSKGTLRSKIPWRWVIPVIAVLAIGGFFGYRHWKAKQTALPEGIASGNGRIAGTEVKSVGGPVLGIFFRSRRVVPPMAPTRPRCSRI